MAAVLDSCFGKITKKNHKYRLKLAAETIRPDSHIFHLPSEENRKQHSDFLHLSTFKGRRKRRKKKEYC